MEALPGIQLEWEIENTGKTDQIEIVRGQLSGSVSVPSRLGSSASAVDAKMGHEYTIVIKLPENITDILMGSALMIDIDFFKFTQFRNLLR